MSLVSSIYAHADQCTVEKLKRTRDELAVPVKRAACLFSLEFERCKSVIMGAGLAFGSYGIYKSTIPMGDVKPFATSAQELRPIADELKNAKRDLVYYRNAIKTLDAEIKKITQELYPKGIPPMEMDHLKVRQNYLQERKFYYEAQQRLLTDAGKKSAINRTLKEIELELNEVNNKIRGTSPNNVKTADLESRKETYSQRLAEHQAEGTKATQKYEALRRLSLRSINQQIFWNRVLGLGGKALGAAGILFDPGAPNACPAVASGMFTSSGILANDCQPLPQLDKLEMKLFSLSDAEMAEKIKTYPEICDQFDEVIKVYNAKVDAVIESRLENTHLSEVTCKGTSVEFTVKSHPDYGTLNFKSSAQKLTVQNSSPDSKLDFEINYATDGENKSPSRVSWKPNGNSWRGNYFLIQPEFKAATAHPVAKAASMSAWLNEYYSAKIEACCKDASTCPQNNVVRKSKKSDAVK